MREACLFGLEYKVILGEDLRNLACMMSVEYSVFPEQNPYIKLWTVHIFEINCDAVFPRILVVNIACSM